MPRGQKNVDWTNPVNDQKLLLAIVKVSEISKKYEEIAAAFGDRVPAISISLRIGKLRKLAVQDKTSPATTKAPKQKESLMTELKAASKPRTKAPFDVSDTEGNDGKHETSDEGHAMTPPKTPNANADKVLTGRVTKRTSPRKPATKDYKKLVDPFMDMEAAKGEDGENVFGKEDRSEEEDSNPSDKEYSRKKIAVKDEGEEVI